MEGPGKPKASRDPLREAEVVEEGIADLKETGVGLRSF